MALVTSLIVYFLIATVSESAEMEKCEHQHHNLYTCPSFDLSSLPDEEKLFVTVHTGSPQQLKEISPRSNIFQLVIVDSVNAVDANSFKDLTGLDVLILEKNLLPIIQPNSFSNLKANALVFKDNQITEMKPDAFKNSKFGLFRITENGLTEIKKGVFNNFELRQLDAFNNKISSIEDGALAELPNLYTLKLENNALTSFDAKKIFGPASNLQVLHLQHNNLATLNSDTFAGLQNLSTLLLGYNQIANIEPGTFNLPYLRKLDLGGNKIQKIDSNILSGGGLKSLWELYLHNNELTSLPTSFLAQLPNLRKITLAGNPWQCGCLNLILKWIKENLPDGFQEQKPACIGNDDENAICKDEYTLDEAELQDFKKQHVLKTEIYD